MLFLLQHHLLQRYKDPCSNSPRLEAAAAYVWWEIEEKLPTVAPGELWKPHVVVFPAGSSRAQVLHKKIPPGQFQVSRPLPCPKSRSSGAPAQQLQLDPEQLLLRAGDGAGFPAPATLLNSRSRVHLVAATWDVSSWMRATTPSPHLPLVRKVRVQAQRREGKLALRFSSCVSL